MTKLSLSYAVAALTLLAVPASTQGPLPVDQDAGGSPTATRDAPAPAVPEVPAVPAALDDALGWLVAHQRADGSWSAAGFGGRCPRDEVRCDGEGDRRHDVGVTALAVLALQAGGGTADGGRRRAIARGVGWLRERQRPDSGLIGEQVAHAYLYDHALATLALAEAHALGRDAVLERDAQRAVHYVHRARNPYSAWRYDVPPIGDNDTSVTGWMLLALRAAREAGLEVDQAALDGGLAWLDEVTDETTGRVGYDARGGRSSRTASNTDHPPERNETMTAVGLACRLALGQQDDTLVRGVRVVPLQADLLGRSLPYWDDQGHRCDMIYWYFGSLATAQLGGELADHWRAALERALLPNQRRDGHALGSWDPVGPWGYAGGRVYATALCTLALANGFRDAGAGGR